MVCCLFTFCWNNVDGCMLLRARLLIVVMWGVFVVDSGWVPMVYLLDVSIGQFGYHLGVFCR